MNVGVAWRLARREARATRRRIGIYGMAVTVGVAALVAINGFRHDMARAVSDESRALLGADLELTSRQAFSDSMQALLDSAAAHGTPVSYVTSFGSMALATRSGATRLVEVRAVRGGFPYYGTIETVPADRYGELQGDRRALVDPALLIQLALDLDDTLAIGEARFVIHGALARVPGEVGLRAALGPRVYIPAQYLDETGLLRFGSRARYAAYLQFADAAAANRFINGNLRLLESARVGYDTAREREDELTDALDLLARYLGLVGLVALLLGGVGVASAVHVFVKDKLDSIAILRCVGADRATVFAAYLIQAALLGLGGAMLGVVVGLAAQAGLPVVLRDLLPLDVRARVDVRTVLLGLGIGVWVAVVFALLPLLTVRGVSPLAALRREFQDVAPRDPYRYLALGALALTVVVLAMWQAPSRPVGLGFAAGVFGTTVALWLVAFALTWAARRFFPRRAPYVVRQGVANLFRPHNQTLSVTLAVGFGVFLLAVVHVVQRNLLDQFAVDARPDRPNLVAFDIQTDQRGPLFDLLERHGAPLLQTTPIVPARVHAVAGQSLAALLADSASVRRSRWALRREYRHTYRDTLVASERVVSGEWHGDRGREGEGQRGSAGGVVQISVEEDLAAELEVSLGDRIMWDVQGVLVETVVTSLRRVDWARFEPNFFVVFQTGALEPAPQTYVALTRLDDDTARAALVGDVVRAFPNVVAVDLTQVIDTLDGLLATVSLGVRFMALFSLVSGVIVLAGAIATSRFQRVRESALLKTLGARARQVRQVLLTEYLALGLLAGLTGAVLAGVGGWALVRFFFEVRFRAPLGSLAGFALAAALLTVVVGLLNTRRVLRQPPLEVIRALGE